MSQIKELLMDQLQDLLHAEGQLLRALPKMVEAAKHPKLKEGFEKHLEQTQAQKDRLLAVFDLLGEKAQAKECKAMKGLVEECEETIKEGNEKDPLSADLALIAAAQRVEHYEISAYGTARGLARQIDELECAKLLGYTLGEEQSADYLLTAMSDPLLQQLRINELPGDVDLEGGDKPSPTRTRKKQ
jgi:Mn-containing catalase